jgi:hypothetical protein
VGPSGRHLSGLNFQKIKTTQEKQKEIVNFPRILVIHFNRVVYNPWGGAQKLQNLVRFPLSFKYSESNTSIK